MVSEKEVNRRSLLHRIPRSLLLKAPGFQTGVKRIRVTPEIAARIRRGEEVSPEEIARAAAEAEMGEARRVPDDTPVPRNETKSETKSEAVNEWLPENVTTPKKKGKGKRR
jgi:hypothetical protein